MTDNNNNEETIWQKLTPIYDFIIYFLVGTVIFLLLVFVTVKVGAFFEEIDIKDHIIHDGLKAIKYLIFLGDCGLYLTFLVVHVSTMVKKLCKH